MPTRRSPFAGRYVPAPPKAVEVRAAMRLFAPLGVGDSAVPLKEEGVFLCDVPPPPRALSPNARVHFQTKAKATAAYQRWVQAAVLLAYPRRDWPVFSGTVRLALTFVYPDERRRDLDNAAASFKAGLDCLVSMGVLRDDGHKVVSAIAVSRRTERGVPARVCVRIEEGR